MTYLSSMMDQSTKLIKAFQHLVYAERCLKEGKVADIENFHIRVREVTETLNSSIFDSEHDRTQYLKDQHVKQFNMKIKNTYEYHLNKVYKLIGADLHQVENLPDFDENPYGL